MLTINFSSKHQEDSFKLVNKNIDFHIDDLSEITFIRGYNTDWSNGIARSFISEAQTSNIFLKGEQNYILFLGDEASLEKIKLIYDELRKLRSAGPVIFGKFITEKDTYSKTKNSKFFKKYIFSKQNYAVAIPVSELNLIQRLQENASYSNEQNIALHMKPRDKLVVSKALDKKELEIRVPNLNIDLRMLRALKSNKDFWSYTFLPFVGKIKEEQEVNSMGKFLTFLSRNVSMKGFLYLCLNRNMFAMKNLRYGFLYAFANEVIPLKTKHNLRAFLQKNDSSAPTIESKEVFQIITSLRLYQQKEKENFIETPFDPLLLKNHLDFLNRPLNVIVFCLDNYTRSSGGVQLFLGVESAKIQNAGGNYFAIYPSRFSEQITKSANLVLMMNDEVIMEFSSTQLSEFFNWLDSKVNFKANKPIVSFHALLGHSLQDIYDSLSERLDVRGIFYLHDFYAFCSSVKLMRNNWTFCGAPPINSMSCKFCVHGNGRSTHSELIGKLINLPQVEIVSPSAHTRDFWLSSYSGCKNVNVFPHSSLIEDLQSVAPSRTDRNVRIAYVGFPNKAKGWFEFERIIKTVQEGVDFYLFSKEDPKILGLKFVSIAQTGQNPNLTTDTLKSNEIDAVFIWPRWEETYSYVAMEALAAGCRILTHKQSGNIQSLAKNYNFSHVYNSIEEVEASLMSGELQKSLKFTGKIFYRHTHNNYILEEAHLNVSEKE
jgi:hypothetical protein